MSSFHRPVMLTEVLDLLDIQPGHWYVDCNLGGGGHTDAILAGGGRVIGLDLDADAIREVAEKHALTIQTVDDHLEAHSDNLILIQSNFSSLLEIITALRHPKRSSSVILKASEGPVSHHSKLSNVESLDSGSAKLPRMTIDGILFDLGVSSYQLETANRGFSFNQDAPLDMRMDQHSPVSAKELVNGLHQKELADLFWKLGEENFARPIARKIVEYRQVKPIETTNELAQLILAVRRRSFSDRTHPATRVFQALRIAVNDELNSLKEALPQAFDLLQPGGILVVISFHSLEDRIVKNYFSELVDSKKANSLTKKPLTPTDSEITANPRSRSGKLRAIQKIG